MKHVTQESGFFSPPSKAPAVSTKSFADRVLELESALADILFEAELSERHPELSFVATQRIAGVVRRALLGADASDDDVAALSERRPERRASSR